MESSEPPLRPTGRLWNPDFPVRPAGFPFFYGWIIAVFVILGISASVPGQTMGVSVFTSRLTEALGLSAMHLSMAYMVGTLLSATLLNAGGRFFDRYGARKSMVGSVVALGAVLVGLSFVDRVAQGAQALPLFARAPWVSPFVILCFGFGLLRFTGQGMVTLSSRAMLGKWFDRRRGTVTAWVGAVVSFAFSGAPIGLEYLIRQFGWQGAWQVMGVAMLLVLAPLFWVFCRDTPEVCGLEMDGGGVPATRKANPDAVIHRDFTQQEATRTFSFWAFTAMFGLTSLVGTAYTFHVLALGSELGVTGNYILGLFLPCSVVSVATGFAVAWLTDQAFVKIKYLLGLMALTSAMAYWAVGTGTYPAQSWVHVLGFGISGGCFGSLSLIIYPRFFGRAHLGAISGVFMTTVVIASAIGPFLFSAAHKAFGSYRSAFLPSAAVALLITVISLRADNPQANA